MICLTPKPDRSSEPARRYVYWIDPAAFERVKSRLRALGYRLRAAPLTPCQALRSRGRRLVYTPPSRWNGFCNRQGSWYRESMRAGLYMVVSDHRLPDGLEAFLAVELGASDFEPERMPGEDELVALIESGEYRDAKPGDWERVNRLEAALMRWLFRVTRFWGRGETLRRHWLGHRANHANFLAGRFSALIDGEDVPHSVTANAGVCSSCAEFFDLVSPGRRKMVRACPGSVTFAGMKRDVFYDVRPVRLSVSARPGGASQGVGS